MSARDGRTAATVAVALVGGIAGAPAVAEPPAPPPAATSKAAQRQEEWRRSRIPLYMNDFGELGHYRKANARLPPAAAGESRVVFVGDSIVSGWPIERSFPGKPYVGRGIGGQTTAQVLVRFRQDVVALGPKVVLILLGTNDIAGNTGPASTEDIEANFTSMCELARAHGIRVVLSSVLPVHDYTPQSELTFPLRPLERIRELNRWLASYAAANGHVYLDLFAAMVDGKGLLRRELAEDGLHPNPAGYAIMAPLTEAAIARALGASAAAAGVGSR